MIDQTAAVYIRVSTDEQASPDKTSLTQQRERCEAYCQSQGWECISVYEDAGVSGSLDVDARPALSRLMKDAAEKRFAHVVFLKLDRLSRNLRNLLNLAHQLNGLGVGLCSIEEHFDTSSPQGKLFFDLLGSFSEFERATINQRMSDGRRGAVRNGKYLAATVPFGYSRENGTLKKHPQQARWVRQIFKWASEGLGLKAIVTKLDKRGVEPPHARKSVSHFGWHSTSVHKMLTSPRYIGKATYSGQPMPCPAIVSEELFNVVQSALKKRRIDSPRNTKNTYLLQHLLWCSHCGGRYFSKSTWNKSGFRTVYLCRQRTAYGQKSNHDGIKWRWVGEELEQMVKRHVLQVIAKPDYLLHDAKIYRVEAEQRVTEYRDQQEGLITSLIKLEQEEARVLAGYQKGVYRDEPQLLEQLASIRSQQEETRTTLNSFEAHDQELTKAERVRLLSDQVVQMHAYQGNLGVFSRPKRKGWVDAALADLEQRETIDVVIPGDEDEPWVTQSVPLNEWWKDTIATLVNRIWVEDDGSLKIEGVIEVANGQVTADNPPR
jgi:site-specific DNA recombinase